MRANEAALMRQAEELTSDEVEKILAEHVAVSDPDEDDLLVCSACTPAPDDLDVVEVYPWPCWHWAVADRARKLL